MTQFELAEIFCAAIDDILGNSNRVLNDVVSSDISESEEYSYHDIASSAFEKRSSVNPRSENTTPALMVIGGSPSSGV